MRAALALAVLMTAAVACNYDVDQVRRPCDPDGTCPSDGACYLGRCLACRSEPLANAGFENGVSSWMPVNLAVLQSQPGGHDSDSAVRVCPGSTNFGVEYASDVPIDPGATLLDLDLWVRSETSVTGEYVISEIEEQPRQQHHHSSMLSISTDWQELPFQLDTVQTPLDRSTTGFRLLVFWSGSSGGVCMDVDDVAFRVCGP